MGLLTDFFVANPTDFECHSFDRLPDTVAAVEAKLVDTVKLSALDRILTGDDGRCPEHAWEAGDDGPWVVSIPEPVQEALAGADAAGLREAAKQWAGTDEWRLDGGRQEDLLVLLKDVAKLASSGKAEGKRLYVWIRI